MMIIIVNFMYMVYIYIYTYGSVRLSSYFTLVAKFVFYTVVQKIDII